MDILLTVLRFIGVLLLVLMVFNLMIVVHEWGHFLAARWRGLRVEAFQIWFGKPIWKKTINGVQYGLGTIPAGGFVKLPQMVTMEAIEGRNDEPQDRLPPITPLDKIIVAFAGPFFSFLLAVAFAGIVSIAGKPVYEAESSRTIGYVVKDSPADRAGLHMGDEILTIDGKKVRSFRGIVDSITWLVVASEGSEIDFLVNRPGEGEKHFLVAAEKQKVDPNLSWLKRLVTRPPFRKAGIGPSYQLIVGGFMNTEANTPAGEAGFKEGDRLLSVNGQKMFSLEQFSDIVETSLGKSLTCEVERGNPLKEKVQKLSLTVTPRLPDQRPKNWEVKDGPMATLGVLWLGGGNKTYYKPSVVEQINQAGRTISQTLSSITSPKSDLSAQHLSGFIGIVHSYYTLFNDDDGWRLVLWFSVVLNVNLAILNLLPFPVLDGGHIVMAIMEFIRRRPMNLRVLEVVQTACVVALLGFMLFISMKDTGDLFGASQRPKDGKSKEAGGEREIELKFTTPHGDATK